MITEQNKLDQLAEMRKRIVARKTDKTIKKFLCIEDGERFIIRAKNIEEAREEASSWNAEVIGETK